jgi:PAS domain S-box-containing protein
MNATPLIFLLVLLAGCFLVIRSLRQAQSLRERTELILCSVADGFLLTDREGRLLLMNPAAEAILGVDQATILNSPVSEVVRDKALADHLSRSRPLSAQRETDLEIFDFGREQMRIFQARTSSVQNRRNEVTGFLTVLRDVTHERQIDMMKNQFISTAAHELRTPLTSIMGYSEILMYPEEFGGFDPERQREFLAEIYEKAEGLSRMLNELLDISRIESGQGISLDRIACRVEEIVERVVREFRLLCPNHSFEVTVRDPSTEFYVDQGKFIRILENLLSNAVKYSPGGGPVRIGADLMDDYIHFTVEDRGIGMTPDQVDRVFDRFYRADASDTAVGGIGLGMNIVKHIITAHGGSIWVESAPGAGTTVSFLLPAGTAPLFPESLPPSEALIANHA